MAEQLSALHDDNDDDETDGMPMTTTDVRPRRYDDEPEDDYDERDVIEADEPRTTAQESEARRELVQGELAGQTVYVPPVKQWRASAMHHLRNGDFEEWAKITLEDDDWKLWQEADPTLGQIEDFFETINPHLGMSRGNSRASRRSSKRTQRR